jgi:hypothetical protein
MIDDEFMFVMLGWLTLRVVVVVAAAAVVVVVVIVGTADC